MLFQYLDACFRLRKPININFIVVDYKKYTKEFFIVKLRVGLNHSKILKEVNLKD